MSPLMSPFLFFGAMALLGGIILTMRVGRTKTWKTADGVITCSDMVADAWRPSPIIEYNYEVGGRTYKADKVAAGWSNSLSDWEMVKKYPYGHTVKVFYNPDNPRQATLEPGTARLGMLLTLMGVCLLFLGVLVSF